MSEQNWAIIDTATGAVLAQVITDGTHPGECGFDFDEAAMTAMMLDGQGDPASQSFADGVWADDPAKIDPPIHAKIDAEAGAVRLRYITDVPGQQLLYAHKESEARAYLAATDPDIADYPLIGADVQVTGATAAEVAQEIIGTAEAWTKIAALIEVARLGAKQAVSAAATREEKLAAAVVDWDAVITGGDAVITSAKASTLTLRR